MNRDVIAEIAIDAAGQLRVRPSAQAFPFIWRAAAEVNWDESTRTLYSPKPREWSYVNCFEQILAAVKDEYGVALQIDNHTRWAGISATEKSAMASVSAKYA